MIGLKELNIKNMEETMDPKLAKQLKKKYNLTEDEVKELEDTLEEKQEKADSKVSEETEAQKTQEAQEENQEEPKEEPKQNQEQVETKEEKNTEDSEDIKSVIVELKKELDGMKKEFEKTRSFGGSPQKTAQTEEQGLTFEDLLNEKK